MGGGGGSSDVGTCVLIVLLWGANPILTRLCSSAIGVEAYMLATSVLSTATTLALTTAVFPGSWRDLSREMFSCSASSAVGARELSRRWLIATADSVLCLALPFFLYNLVLTRAETAALVVTTTWYGAPIVTSVIARVAFGETLTPLQVAGILTSLLGVVLTNFEAFSSSPAAAAPRKQEEEEDSRLLLAAAAAAGRRVG